MESTKGIQKQIQEISQEIFRVEDLPNPSDWCAEYVHLPKLSSAIPGRWNPDLFPYCRGPIDAFLDDEIDDIVLMWSTQLGKTMMLVALLAFVSINQPAPGMLVGPNESSMRELVTKRVYSTFDESPKLQPLLLPFHKRTALMVDLRDMLLFVAWSGSVTRLGEKSVRYLWCTEVDKFSRAETREADSLALAAERTKAFPNSKKIYESTPTIQGQSNIERLYLDSDRRTYRVPCPHCGQLQALVHEQVRWPHNEDGHSCTPQEARKHAHYECIECREQIDDEHKPAMLMDGQWIADNPGSRVAGFNLSSLYSPIISFGRYAEEWLKAVKSKNPKQIQNHINSWQGRTWEPPSKKTDDHEVLNRRGMNTPDHYKPATCPVTPLAVIVTADVQEKSVYFVVRAWGNDGSSYLLRYGQVHAPNQYEKLHIENQQTYSGYKPTHIFIDSGHYTKTVYYQCEHYGWNPMKGHANDRNQTTQAYKSKTMDFYLHMFAANVFKDLLYHKIHNVDLGEAGCWWLHDETDLDYARQITAERRRMIVDSKGRRKWAWVQTGPDNHYLDCEVMQLAAAEVLRIDTAEAEVTPISGDDDESMSYDPMEGFEAVTL